MATPLRIDELTSVTSLSAGSAVAVVQDGATVQVPASAFGMLCINVLSYIPESLHAAIADRTDTTDLTSYIQDACDDAIGKTVYFPKGTYYISTAGGVVLTGQTKMVGDGLQATIIVRNFSPSADNIGAFNLGVRNGTVVQDMIVKSATGTTGGCLVSVVSTASTAASFMGLRNLDLTFDTADTYKYALYIDGAAKTAAPIGARDITLSDIQAFGGTSGAVFARGVVGFTWSGGGSFAGGSTSGAIEITGDATVSSSNVALMIGTAGSVTLDRLNGAVLNIGNHGGVNNTSNVSNVVLLAKEGGTVQTNWTSSIAVSGGQVRFPATQNSSTDVNTLDDYEEGSWTPVLTFATAGDLSVAYSVQVGRYTKIGNRVVAQFSVVTSTFTHTTASGGLQITGLPFTSQNTSDVRAYGAGEWGGITKANYTNVVAEIFSNSTTVTFRISGSGQAIASVSTGDCPTGGTMALRFTVTYQTAT